MARDHARLSLRIWTDTDFQPLSTPAKLLYLFLIGQPRLSYAGALDLSVKRWARAHPDLGVDGVRAALGELDAAEFVVIDHDTEELLVRSFIRNDELYKQPNMLRAALRVAFDIESPMLRRALATELRRLPVEITGPAPAVAARELETGAHTITPTVKAAMAARGGKHTTTPVTGEPTPPVTPTTHADADNPSSNPSPNPSAHPSPMDLGEGSRERGTSLGSLASRSKRVGGSARAREARPHVDHSVDKPATRTTAEGPADRGPGSVRQARRVEAQRLVSVHAPAQPRRVLERLRGEVIGLLADGIESAVIAAGLRVWASKRLPVSWLPELVGEHMRATTAVSTPDTVRRAVLAAETFERVRADAIADNDDSPTGRAVRGKLPAHANPADLDAILAQALDASLPEAVPA